ncbi:uncharacterized protein LOC111162298 [Enhydra lutris kenyoni]|uniref:Uncharacterized protein LOC111162298 n=1 Tax=Enhydra lutris kenyoni TaxID=391180 RepID=A0A2Y9L823_ENHLU|nr:uncharacterized protein LOC111162298 [Enhydra lutris kenyoni]
MGPQSVQSRAHGFSLPEGHLEMWSKGFKKTCPPCQKLHVREASPRHQFQDSCAERLVGAPLTAQDRTERGTATAQPPARQPLARPAGARPRELLRDSCPSRGPFPPAPANRCPRRPLGTAASREHLGQDQKGSQGSPPVSLYRLQLQGHCLGWGGAVLRFLCSVAGPQRAACPVSGSSQTMGPRRSARPGAARVPGPSVGLCARQPGDETPREGAVDPAPRPRDARGPTGQAHLPGQARATFTKRGLCAGPHRS